MLIQAVARPEPYKFTQKITIQQPSQHLENPFTISVPSQHMHCAYKYAPAYYILLNATQPTKFQ